MRGRNVIYIKNEKKHAVVLLIASFNDRFLVQQIIYFFVKKWVETRLSDGD